MAREMYLVGVDESELQPPPKPEPPKGLKGKWANFWYHYKWVTLISLFAVVVLTVILVQMLTQEKEDYRLALVTEKVVPTTVLEELEAELAAYGKDLNGDGKVLVSVENLYIGGQDGHGKPAEVHSVPVGRRPDVLCLRRLRVPKPCEKH